MKKVIDTKEINNISLENNISNERNIVNERIRLEFHNILSDREICDIITSILLKKETNQKEITIDNIEIEINNNYCRVKINIYENYILENENLISVFSIEKKRIKIEKNNIYNLEEKQIYDLLGLEENKIYKLRPDFDGILIALKNLFNGPLEITECYLSYEYKGRKVLLLEKEDYSLITGLEIMCMQIN